MRQRETFLHFTAPLDRAGLVYMATDQSALQSSAGS